jgi:transposase
VVLETAGLNATELTAYCRERGLYPEQVERWRQTSQDANEKPVLTLKEQRQFERLRAQDQKEIKRLKQGLRSGRRTAHDTGVFHWCLSMGPTSC